MQIQKFHKGNYVRIEEAHRHFKEVGEGIVLASGYDSGGNECGFNSYILYIEGYGRSAWYEEYQLELICDNRLDLLDEWMKEDAKNYIYRWEIDYERKVFVRNDGIKTSFYEFWQHLHGIGGSMGGDFPPIYYMVEDILYYDHDSLRLGNNSYTADLMLNQYKQYR
jgi:hypothetical protein